MMNYDKAIAAMANHKAGKEVVLDDETIAQLEAYGNELQDDVDEARITMDEIEEVLEN